MGTKKGKDLVRRLLLRKEELESCRDMQAVRDVHDDVSNWLNNLLRSTTTKYPIGVIQGCCYSWRLAVEHVEKKFDPQRFTT